MIQKWLLWAAEGKTHLISEKLRDVSSETAIKAAKFIASYADTAFAQANRGADSTALRDLEEMHYRLKRTLSRVTSNYSKK